MRCRISADVSKVVILGDECPCVRLGIAPDIGIGMRTQPDITDIFGLIADGTKTCRKQPRQIFVHQGKYHPPPLDELVKLLSNALGIGDDIDLLARHQAGRVPDPGS